MRAGREFWNVGIFNSICMILTQFVWVSALQKIRILLPQCWAPTGKRVRVVSCSLGSAHRDAAVTRWVKSPLFLIPYLPLGNCDNARASFSRLSRLLKFKLKILGPQAGNLSLWSKQLNSIETRDIQLKLNLVMTLYSFCCNKEVNILWGCLSCTILEALSLLWGKPDN